MKQKAYTRVCLVNSAYALFNYLLISSMEEIEKTYFFFSRGIPDTCQNYFKSQANIIKPYNNKVINELYEIYIRFFARYKWPVLKKAELYGMKCGPLFAEIIGERMFTQIEEGGEYIDKINQKRKFQGVRRLLHGRFYNLHACNSPYIKNIYLTGQNENASVMKQSNVIRFNILEQWKSNKAKQQLILEAFNITSEDIQALSTKTDILLTQPLSEDSILSIEEEIKLYKELIKNVSIDQLCIKIHPREKEDKYSQEFKESFIFSKKVPMQLLLCLNCKFSRAFTICSTAIVSIEQMSKNTQIIFAGSKIHPNILKHLGSIELSDYQHPTKQSNTTPSMGGGNKHLLNKVLCAFENRINKPRINIWATLYFNFRTLSFKQAFHFPVLIYGKTKFISLGGKVEFHNCKPRRGLVKIGRQRDYYTHRAANEIDLSPQACMIFNGPCLIGYSCLLRIHGRLQIERMTSIGSSVRIFCFSNIQIGQHCRITFQNTIMDSNCHYIFNIESRQIQNIIGKVSIASFNWIGNNTTIMKGTCTIPHTIVASHSLLNKDYSALTDQKEYMFLAGSPAKVKAEKCRLHRIMSLAREHEITDYFATHPETDYMVYEKEFTDPAEDLITIFK